MYTKAIWKYFLDINMFNIAFCMCVGLFLGILWSIIMFSSFGILIGLLGFQTIKNNEYYTSYNLGITKKYLLKRVWILNLSISLFLFLIYLALFKWLF